MSDIKTWGPNASDQNSLGVPDSAPENATTVADLNDVIREVQAAVRRYYDAPEWRDLGHTPTFVATDQFSVGAGEGASYIVGQRIRINDSTTFYGTISAVTIDTITVTTDNAEELTVAISAVAVGPDLTNEPWRSLLYALIGATNIFTEQQRIEIAASTIGLVMDRVGNGMHIQLMADSVSQGFIGARSDYIDILNNASQSLMRLQQDALPLESTSTDLLHGTRSVKNVSGRTQTTSNQATTASYVTYMTVTHNVISGTSMITGAVNFTSAGGLGGARLRVRRGANVIGEEIFWSNGEGAGKGSIPFVWADTGADGTSYTVEISTDPGLNAVTATSGGVKVEQA